MKFNISDNRVRLNDNIPQIQYLANIHNVSMFPLGEIVVIKGVAKTCKSTFTRILVASLIGSERRFGIAPTDVPINQVHYLDTEQSKVHIQRWLRGVCTLGNLPDDDSIYAHPLRPFSTTDKLNYTIEYMEQLTTGNHLVILDGIRDLVSDINLNSEVSVLMNRLMQTLTHRPNICFTTIIHQNPAQGRSDADAKARGVLGTELMNKLTNEFALTKSDNDDDIIYTARCTSSRDERPYKTIDFHYVNGSIEPCDAPILATSVSAYDKYWSVVYNRLVNSTANEFSRANISNILKQEFDLSQATSDRAIIKWKSRGLLKPTSRGVFAIDKEIKL